MKKMLLFCVVLLGHYIYAQPNPTIESTTKEKTPYEIEKQFISEFDTMTQLSDYIGTYELTENNSSNILSYNAIMIVTNDGIEISPKNTYYPTLKTTFYKTINQKVSNFEYEKGVFWLKEFGYKNPIVRINTDKNEVYLQNELNVYTFKILDFKPKK